MAWTYRSPFSFPAYFPETLRRAVANLHKPELLYSGTSIGCDGVAEDFRYYRWCLREKPEVMPMMTAIVTNYKLRTSRTKFRSQALLYLTATPTAMSDLVTLNPHLERIVSEACQ